MSGASASFTFALGSGDTFFVKFANKEAVAAPPPPQQSPSLVEICKTVLDDGDGIAEGGHFTFDFGAVGQPKSASVTFTIFEGETKCGSDDIVAAGYPANRTFYFTEVGAPAGWVNAAGYPKYDTGSGLVTGSTAIFTLDPQTLEAHVEFVNRDTFDAGEAPEPDPTVTLEPPSTPTPPPTSSPTPPASTPTPTSSPTPGTGGDNQGTPPVTTTPVASDTSAEPGTQEHVAGAATTPLAPSTGTGRSTGDGNLPLALLAGLLAIASSAPLALFARRRR